MSRDAEALRIVEEALDQEDAGAREAFVRAACGDDAALLARVQRILAQEQTGRTLLPASHLLPAGALDTPVPEQIGPWRVEAEIARGGMGAVVRAARNDGLFEQIVAIKLIRGDLASERARERFAAERRILARLQHPAIVRILDGGEVDGRPWLAMDYIDGLPVDEALDAAGAEQRARLNAFIAVAEAVAHAHRQLVIHADLKPSNILMDAGGGVHLLDFGIARLIAGIDVDETGDPYPLTRSFAAPERGVGVVPTVASDVYSLGVMLLVMLGHEVPAADADFVPGTRLPAGLLEGDLAAIAARALAELPEDRYPDAAALAEDVRRHLADLPVRAREGEGWRYPAARFIRRHRKGLALTVLAGLALLATSVGATLQYYRAEAARAEADARFDDARGVANYLLFDLIPSLEDTPGTLARRVAAAAEAERYLTRLAGARQADDGLRLETARGLLQLAGLQGRAGRPNLHQPEAASANLVRAETIAAALPGAEARQLLARIHIERLRLAAWMQADVAEAARLAEVAERSVAATGDPQLQLELALALASLRGFEGKYAEQEALARQALAALGPQPQGAAALDRALLLSFLAESIYYRNRPDEALLLYRESLAIVEAATRAARTPFHLDRLAKAEWEVGTTLAELRQYPEAIRRLARAEQLAAQVAALDPDNKEGRRVLSGMRTAHAQALGLSGQTDAALAVLEANRDELARLYAAENTPQLARDLAYAHTVIGETLSKGGRRAQACAADRLAAAQYAALRERGWINAFDEGQNLRLVNDRIAANCDQP